MNIEEFREYCLLMEGVTEKTPFGKFAAATTPFLCFMSSTICFVSWIWMTSLL